MSPQRFIWLVLPALLACNVEEDTDPSDLEAPECDATASALDAALVHSTGCSDLTLHAWTEDGSILLSIGFPGGLLAEAHQAGGSWAETWDLPDPAVEVELLTGTCLGELACNDALSCMDHPVDIERTAASGTLHLALTEVAEHPDCCWDYEATATVSLCDLVLQATGEPNEAIGVLSWSASVGWLPG
jgi:hypothetical protein